MKKGERKCKRCGRIISKSAPRCYAQKITVRNYRKIKHHDGWFINKIVYYKTMLICQQCYDDIKKADGIFAYEIPKKYLVKKEGP
jgi:hypothetical protein